ncbi:alpha-mannosidase [Mariniflexile sp.]|uniref:alpha-mannosidase n=1 Tax=Mariniflexile sp. TaxID=1979402 RepID=UPI00404787E5
MMKKKIIVFFITTFCIVGAGVSQTPTAVQQNTLDYIKRAADGDHLALEGGHLELDGHVMPYPFFETHEVLYLYRLSQLRHRVVWKADEVYYEEGWKEGNQSKKSIPASAKKISPNVLNGERLSHETYWLQLPKLPKSETGWERFFCLQPMELTLPGWPETTIYVNGESKAALMRQHFYWSLNQLLDETKPNFITLKSFGIYDNKRGYKEISVVERDPDIDELYWYMRVLIEAKSILTEKDKGFAEISGLANDIMAKLNLDIAKTTVFRTQLKAFMPSVRSRFKDIEAMSDSKFTLKMLDHGHLDSAWRWTLDNTDEKIERLVLNNLYLMDRYPEYKYIFTTPYHYERMSQLFPKLFKRVQEKIKTGQWVADGSTYCETDMNLPGGESIVREFLYGLDYYRNTLGVTKNSLFLPDTFGYPRFLPQIAQGFGIDHLVAMRVNTPEIGEHIIYKWKGIDGTEILVNGLSTPAWEYPFVSAVHGYGISDPEKYTTYNAPDPGPRRLLGTYNQFKDKAATNNQIMLIGWGDGGGGGTEDQLELKKKGSSLPSFPKVEWTNMYDYITNQKKNIDKFAEFDQRLIADRFVQRTYIYANGLKTGNRAAEQRLRETEALSSMAMKYGFKYPEQDLKRLWKELLIHHFHDILTGMAVPEVLLEANASIHNVEAQTKVLRDKALDFLLTKMATDDNALVVFNPSGVNMSGVVEVPNAKIPVGMQLVDDKGNAIPFVSHNSKLFVDLKKFDPMSFITLYWKPQQNSATDATQLSATQNTLENDLVKITFNAKGEISSYFDKKENRELVPRDKKWNTFYAVTADSDTAISEKPFNGEANVQTSNVTFDALKASFNMNITYNTSTIKQEAYLTKGSKLLSFKTTIDWKEPQRLEVDFPLNFTTTKAHHGIQFGEEEINRAQFKAADSLKMPFCAHQWTDISDEDYGVAVFDNVRYGYDLKKNGIRLILSYGQRKQTYEELAKVDYTVKGAAEDGGENFSYAVFPHTGAHSSAGVVQKAKAFNSTLISKSASKNSTASKLEIFIKDLPDNIVLQTIKKAENGKGIIIRLYETNQKSTVAEVDFPTHPASIEETNLNEDFSKKLQISADGKSTLTFRPFEIKTLRIQP